MVLSWVFSLTGEPVLKGGAALHSPARARGAAGCGQARLGKTLSLTCVSTAFVAKTLPVRADF